MYTMAVQKSRVINLYKTLLRMGKDYPLGYEFFRHRCHRAFMKNRNETNPENIERMISHGNFVVKELEAMYKLRKYRAMKKRYYSEDDKDRKS